MMRIPPLFLAAVTLAASACGRPAAAGPEASPALASPSPSQPAVGGPEITGLIRTLTSPSPGRVVLLVEADTPSPVGDRASVTVSSATSLTDARATLPVAATIDQLQVGQRVAVQLQEPMLTSYPVQAGATELTILEDTSLAPTMVAPAASVRDCGRESLGQPNGAPNPAARACLAAAASNGTPAGCVSVLTTVEGDLIPVTVEVVGANHVMLTVDTTRDRFGGDRAVSTYRCTGAQLVPAPNDPSREQLHVLGCADLRDPYVIQ